MKTRVLLGGLFLALPVLSPPPGKKPAPSGLPPLFCTASASKGPGKSVVVLVSVPQTAARLEGKTVPKLAWPQVKVTVVRREFRVVLDPDSPSQLEGSRFFTVQGNPVKDGEILKRLEKGAPILLSATGKKVDPYYLQVIKPKTLILVLGLRDGAPNLDLHPRILAAKKEK